MGARDREPRVLCDEAIYFSCILTYVAVSLVSSLVMVGVHIMVLGGVGLRAGVRSAAGATMVVVCCSLQACVQLVGEYEVSHSLAVAHWIKQRVQEVTGCRVSIGIGGNLLLAKMAGQMAKPSNKEFGASGIFRLDDANAKAFMSTIKLKDLPGIGWR